MSKPWKIVNQTADKIELERDGEHRELARPKDKANLAVFLALRPDELLDETTVENFLAEKGDDSA